MPGTDSPLDDAEPRGPVVPSRYCSGYSPSCRPLCTSTPHRRVSLTSPQSVVSTAKALCWFMLKHFWARSGQRENFPSWLQTFLVCARFTAYILAGCLLCVASKCDSEIFLLERVSNVGRIHNPTRPRKSRGSELICTQPCMDCL